MRPRTGPLALEPGAARKTVLRSRFEVRRESQMLLHFLIVQFHTKTRSVSDNVAAKSAIASAPMLSSIIAILKARGFTASVQ